MEFEPNHLEMVFKSEQEHQLQTKEQVHSFLSSMIERAGMRIAGGPWAMDCHHGGNEGPFGVGLLWDSHVAIHSWTKRGLMQGSIYSCKEFDPEVIVEMFDEFGKGTLNYIMIDRNELLTPTASIVRYLE